MKIHIKIFTLFIILTIYCVKAAATDYIWVGTTSSWTLTTNWSPAGIPTTTDNVTIANAAAQPQLNASRSINNFTINSGTLDLNGFTLTITGIATYTAGSINNGTTTSTGTSTTFAGTVFGAIVNATSNSLVLNGSTFNNTVNLTKNGASDILSNGGNTFNTTATITNSGNGYLALAYISPDIFNGETTFVNTGSSALYVAFNSAGNLFNGNVTFTNTGTASTILSHFGGGATAVYNGNIVVNNSSTGVYFGALGGTASLAATKTISVGGTGFTTGTLLLCYFTQSGATTQTLSLTGTALIQMGPSLTFNGTVNFTAPQLLLNGCLFNGPATLTKNGATDNLSVGGNIFNSTAVINNSGSGYLALANTSADIFNGDVTFTNSGSNSILPAFLSTGNQFNGNTTFNNTGTGSIFSHFGATASAAYNGNIVVNNLSAAGGIYFGGLGGSGTLAATKTISLGGTGFATGTLLLCYLTQAGSTAQSLTLTGTALLQMGPSTTFNGNVNFVSPQVIMNGCTFNGTAYIEKNGTTQNNSLGGNIFNGTTTLANTGPGVLVLGFPTGVDIFNGNLTVNNTGSSVIYLAYNTAGHQFNGNVVLNETTGTGILFCTGTGTATLATGKTISIGGSGFSSGLLIMPRFTQTGTTAQTLSLTGTALLQVGPSSTFNGNVDFTAPQLLLDGCTYNGTASLTKNGATDNTSAGNNVFNAATTITNSGSGFLRLANTTADDFNADVSFVKSSSGNLEPSYATNSTFSGNVTVNSSSAITFGAGPGMAVFDGANAQTISKAGSANPVFNRMRINKSANDVSLNTEIAISTSLAFTQQNIISTPSNLLVFNDNATHSGGSNSSYIAGPVRKTGNDAFTFPVGKNNYYRPISVSAPGAVTDHFTAEYFKADPNTVYPVSSKDITLDHTSRCEYWMLNRTNGASDVNVTLSWDVPSCGVSNLPDLRVARWDGSTWKDHGNGSTTGTTSSGTIMSSAAVTAFSPFTLASSSTGNPLPVELLHFTAMPHKGFVDITWSTASETNNNYFEVRRTADGINFETIATVEGAGNSHSIINYKIVDYEPLVQTSYYQLKQVDFDGQYKNSALVSVDFKNNSDFKLDVFPNPSNGYLNLSLTSLDKESKEIVVMICDMHGGNIFTKEISIDPSNHTINIALPNIVPGIYFISASVSGKLSGRQKLIVY